MRVRAASVRAPRSSAAPGVVPVAMLAALAALAVLAVLALLATACTPGGTMPAEAPATTAGAGSAPGPGTGRPRSTLVWTACGATLDCATVEVPLDYTRPGDRQVPIALQRHKATGAGRIGALLVNPGGPGESGIDSMQTFLDLLSPAVRSHFDLVAFDPRGVGRSEGVQCVDGPTLDKMLNLDPAPTTPAGRQALLDADRALVAGCQAHNGDLLPFVGTVNAARDMEGIRVALGEPALTYFGFSYGTLLGAIYADLFPTHVRAMVLDGAIDPAVDPVSSADTQSTGLDEALGRFFADCSAAPACAWRPGENLHQAFDKLMAAIRAHPLAVGSRSLGPGDAFYGVAAPLYDRQGWPRLAQALQAASTGDGAPLLQLSDVYTQRNPDGTYSDALEANAAISCADERWPSDPNAYPKLAADAAKLAPEFGPANIYGSVVCSVWPVQGTLRPHPVKAPGSPPLLVVGSTGDPVTPYAWATSLASELDRGVLLTRVGEGHTGYPSSACIRADVDSYLIGLTAPPTGTTCPS